MQLSAPKSEIIAHFQDPKESLDKLKQFAPGSKTVESLEKRQRLAKLRGYLEARFYRYQSINKELYQRLGGDLKFLGL